MHARQHSSRCFNFLQWLDHAPTLHLEETPPVQLPAMRSRLIVVFIYAGGNKIRLRRFGDHLIFILKFDFPF